MLNDSENNDLRLAVLIDADNVPYSYVKEMMEEIARYGVPTIKRIYGDWTQPTIAGWKNCLLVNAITPVQQYSYTYGKNSTDSAMIIDAMDILYSDNVDGFCIVSSDSDFTRLATRLREAGKRVIGIGEKKTPAPFIAACDKFIYLEILKPAEPPKQQPQKKAQPKKGKEPAAKEPAKKTKRDDGTRKSGLPADVIRLISDSIDIVADDDGWAFLGEIGNLISKKRPDFDPRNYGFMKLSQLIKSSDAFLFDVRETGNKSVKHIYIKNNI
ncbi:MAG: NYN domain-containing protein [Clostridia bacterium]|nr:NYN domain-containing protein [Clostridia bacterium]MBR5426973.1 NYN domain-containing protein [Clostridia bacterium]